MNSNIHYKMQTHCSIILAVVFNNLQSHICPVQNSSLITSRDCIPGFQNHCLFSNPEILGLRSLNLCILGLEFCIYRMVKQIYYK